MGFMCISNSEKITSVFTMTFINQNFPEGERCCFLTGPVDVKQPVLFYFALFIAASFVRKSFGGEIPFPSKFVLFFSYLVRPRPLSGSGPTSLLCTFV